MNPVAPVTAAQRSIRFGASVRIALFSETFAPQRNGVALILARLVRFLSDRGHEVLVATADFDLGGEPEPPIPAGVQVVKVPGFKLPRYPDLTMAKPFAPRVLRAVRGFRPDVVHVVTEYSLGLSGLWIARRLRVPALASFHTNIPGCLPYYGFGWASGLCWEYLRWFHNRAGLTLCPSETNRQILLSRGFSNVRVWGRGVDTERFAPDHRNDAARRQNGPPDAVQLLYVGRLTPEKDLPTLFRAYRAASAKRPGVPLHLVLAGDGAYSSRMRHLAPPNVTFTGYVDGPALSQVYSAADIFVFPSRVETLGNVVLEAMASGLPVIGADQGGTVENVRHGLNGLLVPAGDADRFADAILRLVDDQALRGRLARNARAWAEERSWERAFETLLASYEERMTSP
jgi:glycosyltransferase involved in cell wall biosynthesis